MRTKGIVLLAACLILLTGCGATLETMLVGYSMVSFNEECRNHLPNIWGPVQPEPLELWGTPMK